jgi:hypothetical protein
MVGIEFEFELFLFRVCLLVMCHVRFEGYALTEKCCTYVELL